VQLSLHVLTHGCESCFYWFCGVRDLAMWCHNVIAKWFMPSEPKWQLQLVRVPFTDFTGASTWTNDKWNERPMLRILNAAIKRAFPLWRRKARRGIETPISPPENESITSIHLHGSGGCVVASVVWLVVLWWPQRIRLSMIRMKVLYARCTWPLSLSSTGAVRDVGWSVGGGGVGGGVGGGWWCSISSFAYCNSFI